MIHFDCPNCGERMDIDSGFRGAVARCEQCGALIQVPTKAGAGPAEHVKRPATPPSLTPRGGGPKRRTGEHGSDRGRPRRRSPARWLVLGAVATMGALAAAAWWIFGRGAL
ncbi:MAG: hypothetical protein EA379_03730 [Phycisphaerales bacterium]|nr:MAG: hypothetical protein EA379_03730 [Phycisphaerales bacterium]